MITNLVLWDYKREIFLLLPVEWRKRDESFLLVIGELCNQRTRSSQNVYIGDVTCHYYAWNGSVVLVCTHLSQKLNTNFVVWVQHQRSFVARLSVSVRYARSALLNRHIKIQTFLVDSKLDSHAFKVGSFYRIHFRNLSLMTTSPLRHTATAVCNISKGGDSIGTNEKNANNFLQQ